MRDVAGQAGVSSPPPDNLEFAKTTPYHPFGQWREDPQDRPIRCGREAEIAANRTETATILAGTEAGFRILRQNVAASEAATKF